MKSLTQLYNAPTYDIADAECSEIEKFLKQNYIDYASKVKMLSSEQLDEIQLKAIIKNDFDLIYVTELARI